MPTIGVAALNRGNRQRHHAIEFVEIHGMVQGLFGLIKNSIEFGFLGVAVQPGMSFLQRPPRDLKILLELSRFEFS